MMQRFSNRIALITGAGGPMGMAMATRLASESADLILSDISGRRLDANTEILKQKFPDIRIVAERASVVVEDELEALLKTGERLGPVDVLINVVGGVRGGLAVSIADMTPQRWTETFDLNLKGTLLLVKALAPGMKQRGYGRIVNFSSISYAGDLDMPEYGAAKAAVASLTRAIALEFAPVVTANCVAPGPIETSIMERMDEKMRAEQLQRTPLRKFGKPEDVAAAVAFLASDDAAHITGTILPVAGGIWPAL